MTALRSPILEELATTGRAMLNPFTRRQIVDIRAHLWSREVYTDAHVPIGAIREGRGAIARTMLPSDCECFCTSTRDAILTPHVLERALSLTDIAADYVGRNPPVMYSMNAFWTRPGPKETRSDIQEFHIDPDDTRFVALFLFLTDVDNDAAQELTGPDGIRRGMTGPAGTVFLADTSHSHRGKKPRYGERGIMWVRWGASDQPAANISDEIKPIDAALLGERYPRDLSLRESIKLLVR